jgi:nitroreductase
MTQQENFEHIIQFRRSNRKFDPEVKVPGEVIERSLQRAILSPNSSNMQLWEFHWVSSAAEKAIVVIVVIVSAVVK